MRIFFFAGQEKFLIFSFQHQLLPSVMKALQEADNYVITRGRHSPRVPSPDLFEESQELCSQL